MDSNNWYARHKKLNTVCYRGLHGHPEFMQVIPLCPAQAESSQQSLNCRLQVRAQLIVIYYCWTTNEKTNVIKLLMPLANETKKFCIMCWFNERSESNGCYDSNKCKSAWGTDPRFTRVQVKSLSRDISVFVEEVNKQHWSLQTVFQSAHHPSTILQSRAIMITKILKVNKILPWESPEAAMSECTLL